MDVLRLREKSDGRCGPPPERGKLLGEICGLRVALLCGRIALLALARGLLFCGVQKHLGMWLEEEEVRSRRYSASTQFNPQNHVTWLRSAIPRGLSASRPE